MSDRTVGPKIISSVDAAMLETTLNNTESPAVGPGHPVVLRAKVTLVIDELPNVGPDE